MGKRSSIGIVSQTSDAPGATGVQDHGYYKLDRINSVASKDRSAVFNNLIQLVNEDNLRQAFRGGGICQETDVQSTSKSPSGF
jgi:hypothetical protein